ncbi:hypothetical protein KSS87_018319 [Heliosperma pusillum]|nr:hypothetical protein KSS87_018319 [Heliosperma pusillum]
MTVINYACCYSIQPLRCQTGKSYGLATLSTTYFIFVSLFLLFR